MNTRRALFTVAFAAGTVIAAGAVAHFVSLGAQTGELYAAHNTSGSHRVYHGDAAPQTVADIGMSADAMGAVPLGGTIHGGTKYDVTQPHDFDDMSSITVAHQAQ